MAPQRPRKRKNTASSASDCPAPVSSASTFIPIKTASPVKTPSRSRTKRKVAITQAQKQALIDNLQLEITERARKLRAQYALQAQALKTRLEIRVHRIPAALRKTTIAELLERYAEQCAADGPRSAIAAATAKPSITSDKSRVPRPSPVKADERTLPELPPSGAAPPGPPRGMKRTSADLHAEANKENAPVEVTDPKKRARTAAATITIPSSEPKILPSTTAARPRLAVPPQVLSPRSNNTRIIPPSPTKSIASPAKSFIARPVSPLKPSITVPTASSSAKTVAPKGRARAPTVTRPASVAAKAASTAAMGVPPKRGKRGAAGDSVPASVAGAAAVVNADVPDGRVSRMSDASASTTVVTKGRRGQADDAPASTATLATTAVAAKGKKGGLAGKLAGLGAKGRKVAAAAAAGAVGIGGNAEKEAAANVGSTVKGGRVLRKRA